MRGTFRELANAGEIPGPHTPFIPSSQARCTVPMASWDLGRCPDGWTDLPKVLELAKRPNAVIKVSGACTLSREPYPFPDIWDPLARVFDAWRLDRCLWGTDWTRAFAVVNYEQAVEPFLKTDRLSDTERTTLMGGACAKAYGWSPKKG